MLADVLPLQTFESAAIFLDDIITCLIVIDHLAKIKFRSLLHDVGQLAEDGFLQKQ